ncbi:PmoA family protein [Actinoplanes siamensis]|uniref:Uncharacterized protein n=1 Tax=Actinoplanes siamensis TaxID=1223317 RepID=A0A919NCN5_9ACTN|nr:PmoA family protein [Actinoplanes siamensis]GIF08431.1 hypothetical protein Asi03nite_59690 [Actinoplanes siamensis]
MHPLPSRMRAALTAGRSVTVSAGDSPLFRYGYGAAQPRLSGLHTLAGTALPATIDWSPPHAGPGPATHLALTDLSAGPATATVAHHLRWAAVDEWRSLTASLAGDDVWLLLFENTVTNTSGRRLPLDGPSLSLRAVTAPSAARSEWQAAHGPGHTLVVVDDAANLQHPPRWAGLSPAPFGAGARLLQQDQTIAFRYAVIIASGGHSPGALAALGRDALGGPFPGTGDPAPRGHVCHGEHTRRGPIHRTRTRVLTRQCESRGAPPTA